MKVLIIGYGIIGHYIEKSLQSDEIEIYINDPAKGFKWNTSDMDFDYALICVPTDLKNDNTCDISIVEQVISESEARINIIKSAIPPGTTDYLIRKYNKRIICSPEYYGATIHANSIKRDFIILGGKREDTIEAAKLFKKAMTGFDRIIQTDSKTAELVKYMENSYLACKVVFCNEFYRIAKAYGIDYNELRELWLLDSRVNPSHTLVFEDHPYYDSHCLNKDIPAIFNDCEKYEPLFLKSIYYNNERFKGE